MDYTLYKFSEGELFISGDSKGLTMVSFLRDGARLEQIRKLFSDRDMSLDRWDQKFDRLLKLFDNYFSGRQEFFTSISLNYIFGTPYQHKVWDESRKVTYGETASYKVIAERLSNRGYRSIGQALNKNPLLILVPCHRIISADGSLGGFGAGLRLKNYLLSLEKN